MFQNFSRKCLLQNGIKILQSRYQNPFAIRQFSLLRRRTFKSGLPVKQNYFKRLSAACFAGCLCYITYNNKLWTSEGQRVFLVQLGGIRRFLRTFKIGLVISLDYWWTLRGLDVNSEEYKKLFKKCHQRSAQSILSGSLLNGGLYIKMCQGLATVNHILPQEYLNTLIVLQDQGLTRKAGEVDTLFLEDFGKTPLQMFSSFEYEPIAAASLAQVHKAITFDGEVVAVKVQYIDLRDRYSGDMWAINTILKLIEFIHPSFGFSWIFEDMKHKLVEELDFEQEGENGERCFRELKHLKFVSVPKINWDMTTKRVLTAEFIDGCRVDDIEAIKMMGLDVSDVARKLVKAFGEQIFGAGFIHADPHSSNVFVRRGSDGKAELVILDHGLYESLESRERLNLCNLWKSIVLNNQEAIQHYSQKLGVQDYKVLCEILLQRPFNWDALGSLISSRMNTEELKHMTARAKDEFDKIMAVLKELPSSLILVIRNLNAIRAINQNLGDPVDRFVIMAHSAVAGARSVARRRTWYSRYTTCMASCYFELRIRYMSMREWFITKCLSFLHYMKFIPDEMVELQLKYSKATV